MLTRTQITLIVISLSLIILFAITYFILFKMAFKSKIKLIQYGDSDDEILKSLTKEYKKYNKKERKKSFLDTIKDKNKHSILYTITLNVVIGLFSILCIGLIVIGLYFRLNNQQVFINDTTLLVVETGSMSVKEEHNTYLTENNLNNQIKARSLINIKKTNDYQIYDICAFNTKDGVVVHRIIDIKEENGKKLYTFRGDANRYSINFEIGVAESDIIGEFNGLASPLLGTTILFMQSGIGMISILVSLIIYALYTIYYDQSTKAFEERTVLVLETKYDRFREKETVYTIYQDELTIPVSTPSIIENILEVSDNTNEIEDIVATEDVVDHFIVEDNEQSQVMDAVTDDDESTLELEETFNVELDNNKVKDFSKFSNIEVISYPEKMLKHEFEVRDYYNELKSYIMSYSHITNRVSNRYETFKYKNNKLFLLEIRGTKLKLNIAYNDELDTKYHTKLNDSKKLEDYKYYIKITSDRALKYAKEIINIVVNPYELPFNDDYKDYMTILMLDFDKSLSKRYSLYARLSLADDEVRNNYNNLKNLIMSYDNIKSRLSFNYDTFTDKYIKLFMIELRGETLRLHIADDINNYDEKYHLKENSNKKALEYPIYLKVKSARSLKYAKEIIDKYLLEKGYNYNESNIDYLEDFPKMTELDLITIGQIKLRRS